MKIPYKYTNTKKKRQMKKNLIKELFIEDGLHMTRSGYEIWAAEIAKYIH
jgi:lysophospholipase L1-like esterase